MVQQKLSPMDSVAQFVLDKGLRIGSASGQGGTVREWEEFSELVLKAAAFEAQGRADAHRDERDELRLQRAAGVLDEGQSDYDSDYDQARVDAGLGSPSLTVASNVVRAIGLGHGGDCFTRLCQSLGVTVGLDCASPADLSRLELLSLRSSQTAMVGYIYYGIDDPRNHVVPVRPGSKSVELRIDPLKGFGEDSHVCGITSPQHFFNEGTSFYMTKFYSDNDHEGLSFAPDIEGQQSSGFGGDVRPTQRGIASASPAAPESIVDGGAAGGGSNVTGGVVRPKRRNIKARSDFMTNMSSLRSYGVSAVTMFNNMEEMYLNTISKEYAQEIVEELFTGWGLPTGEPTVMKYAEDVLWAFLIARTASNKADYKFQIDVPTKSGDVEVDFDFFSRLLANKYGISRRNFARGVADNLRDYLRREENQHLRSLSAQRVGADPQMGDMCFDGSTGCTNLTSSEASFARLLEARNLYERDDVIAEGASDRLMQGMSGGVRSVVPR